MNLRIFFSTFIIFALALHTMGNEAPSSPKEISGYVTGFSGCNPFSYEDTTGGESIDPFKNGAVEASFDNNKLSFEMSGIRYSCQDVMISAKMVIIGDTLNIFTEAKEFIDDYDSECTCEYDFEMIFFEIPSNHYIINMIATDGVTIYATCDTTLTDGFKHMIFDNRKPLPSNYRLSENYHESKCLADMDYEAGGQHDPELPTEEELSSVMFSYAENTLHVELRGWLYNCGSDTRCFAIVEEDTITIQMTFSLATSCVCYKNISFDFCGIDSGERHINLRAWEYTRGHDESYNREYDLDLQHGFSQLFLKGTNTLVNNRMDESIAFDGCLVEFVSNGKASVEVFSTEGELMARTEGSGNVRLSTTSLMPGVYIVRATTNDGAAMQRKVVVK